MELIIISYVYGINNYLADLKHIVGFDPANWLRYPFVFMYSVLSPLLILVILISSWATHESLESGGYLYPGMHCSAAAFQLRPFGKVKVRLMFQRLWGNI